MLPHGVFTFALLGITFFMIGPTHFLSLGLAVDKSLLVY